MKSLSEEYRVFLDQRRFGSLDGLRAISILAVIWSHGPGQISTWRVAASGRYGVDLFFAISGFLITTLLLRERSITGEISLRQFYARRALRIFPLYYAILLLYCILVWGSRSGVGRTFFSNLPYFLTYTSNWFVPTTATFGFAWSLSTEEQFYCVWPWLEVYGRKVAAVLMIGLMGMALLVNLKWIPLTGFPRTVISSIALPICFGVLLAHGMNDGRWYKVARRVLGVPGAPLIAFVAAAVAIQFRLHRFILSLLLSLVVGSCVVREDHVLRPVTSNGLLRLVGEVSYGMYLMHGLIYDAVEIPASHMGFARHGLPVFFVSVLLTFLAATLSFRTFESYFHSLKNRFEPRRRAVSRAATVG